MNASMVVPLAVQPSARARRRLGVAACSTAGLVAAFAYLDVNPFVLFRDFHFVTNLLHEMLPPNLALLWNKTALWTSLVVTISMAFLGTVGGVFVAFILALLAAANTTPHRRIRLVVRALLATERCTPSIAVLLVLLTAVGIGPFAGVLALLIGSVGLFGKLFADAIEQVEVGPVESAEAVGATRLQIIRYAILPQVAPSIVANSFYAFDFNLRAAVALGVFGAGGIGFELNLARAVLRYKDMFACLILVIAMITVMERAADYVRRRIFLLEASLK